MDECRPAKLSYLSEMEGGHAFTLLDSDGNALAVFVYPHEHDARWGVRFKQSATERALGVVSRGSF